MKIHPIASSLLSWYKDAFRPLPWRETTDPYRIWLSEIILQQTRVEQGLSYYHKFTGRFPSVADLAGASEDEVLLCWQGLGYYSRARNLHASAKMILEKFNGIFPKTYEEILSLKGVGPYTAAAISSIAYNLPHAVVDGNVFRVLSRLFGISTPIDSPKGAEEFRNIANSLIDHHQPGNFNQAMMELGAIICKPQNPDCNSCPLSQICYARKNGEISSLPVKGKKVIIKERWFYFIVMTDPAGNTLVVQRKAADIWKGLFEFPLIETSASEWSDTDLNLSLFDPILKKDGSAFNGISAAVRHILSHQHLHTRFLTFSVSKLPQELYPESIVIPFSELKTLAFPRLITRYLEKINF